MQARWRLKPQAPPADTQVMRWFGAMAMVWVCACGVPYTTPEQRADWGKSVPQRHHEAWEREHGVRSGEGHDDADQLLVRAQFDLQCPGATTVVLERHSSGPAILVGAAGCGRQAEYRRRLRRNGWGGFTTDNTRWDRAQGGTVFVAVD